MNFELVAIEKNESDSALVKKFGMEIEPQWTYIFETTSDYVEKSGMSGKFTVIVDSLVKDWQIGEKYNWLYTPHKLPSKRSRKPVK